MSQELINRSADLKRLQYEGFEIEVKNGYVMVHHVPYVNAQSQIRYGTLISTLTLQGDKTTTPDTHVIHFAGEHPCNKNGSIMTGIQHASQRMTLATEIVADHAFSNKPSNGYADYYEKFMRYIEIISAPARSIDPSVTAQTYKLIEFEEDSAFEYLDTNSSRAGIGFISDQLRGYKIGIVGLGGTGSYILDLIAKTPVAEIHLFDGDDFLQHNAFRAPGAPSKDELAKKQTKTDYLSGIYKNMHKHVVPHNLFLGEEGMDCLLDLDFIFICIDQGKCKHDIIDALIAAKKGFIDTGIGVDISDNSLFGTVRITAATPDKTDHLSKYISFSDKQDDDPYSSNIQIAELNALNAALAVLKWKQFVGFYQDLAKNYHLVYSINVGETCNEN